MNLPKLLEDLKSGLDDLLLIDPNHLYAELLEDSIEAIETQRRSISRLLDENESFRRKYNQQIETEKAEHAELCARYSAEIDRLNGLLAARTRGQTVIYHGGKYSAAELLDIVKAGEDRAKYLASLYDGAAAELCDCERKRAELDGVAEQYRIYRDRVDDLQRKIDRHDEAFGRVLGQRDEAIEEVRRLKCQLRQIFEGDSFLAALRPRSFFAMPGLEP